MGADKRGARPGIRTDQPGGPTRPEGAADNGEHAGRRDQPLGEAAGIAAIEQLIDATFMIIAGEKDNIADAVIDDETQQFIALMPIATPPGLGVNTGLSCLNGTILARRAKGVDRT